MRIVIYSDCPWQKSGYGRVTKELALRFRELGHDIAIASMGLIGNSIDWGGITIYPSVRHSMGFDSIGAFCRHFYADAVLSLYDIWSFPPNIGRLIEPTWIAYTPIDGAPVPQSIVDRLSTRRADPTYVVSMSQYGERELDKAGIDNIYIPLGIDCDVFKPGEKETARTALSIPQDVFMVTMVAANRGYPARKSWLECLTAFQLFNRQHPNSMLYAHTNRQPLVPQGILLDRFAEELAISDRVVFADECELAVGVPDEQMVSIYQASDVLLSPSMGEGFGLPILEAQSCGTPVITQQCSAMPELTLFGDCIEPQQSAWITQLDYYWQQASVERIVEALNLVHEITPDPDFPQQVVEQIRSLYHWPTVIEQHWKPFLEKVEGEQW